MNFILTTDNPRVDKYLRDLWVLLQRRGVKLALSSTDQVVFGKEYSNGVFDNEQKTLWVAIGKPQEKWLRIMVHEACHCDQWFEDCRVWREYEKASNIFDWIQTKRKWSKQKVYDTLRVARNLELDCEKRTISKIKKYKLPIDVERYEREATAYCLFYTFMGESKKWYKIGKEPYNNEKLIALLKDGFKTNFDIVTKEQKELFKECI